MCLLLLETVLGVTGTTVNGGAETYGDYVNLDPDINDPFFKNGPSRETLLTAVKDRKLEEVTEMTNRGTTRVVTRAKPNIEFERSVIIVIEMIYIAYYGDCDELVCVQRVSDDEFYQWTVLKIVGMDVPLVLDTIPRADSRKIMEKLLTHATEMVDIDLVMMDREFDSDPVKEACEDTAFTT